MTKLSREHEDFIADQYGGKRSPSSGAGITDGGDVRVKLDGPDKGELFECKMTGIPGGHAKQSTLVKHMEKVAEEAWEEGREPAVCLRFWNPKSILSDGEGWIDLTVRITRDDAKRGSVGH